MVMATIDKDMAEFRLQDGRIFRILQVDHQSNFKPYIWDKDESSWVAVDWLGDFGRVGKHFYRDALATFVSLVPLD